ncbi:MAG: phosphate signaling complex protein PhoU [Actinobacteria bacterium]|jgi:phosphate transport system protein|nr:phosphate signaling complex protein PhoU [Actinomycetota bacterium]MDA2985369.1 phosphate signaling complex protein PhoU [Actinomycetota bacterium]
MAWLRSAFQDELDGVTATLVELSTIVTDSMVKATHSLLTASVTEAEEVIASDDRVDRIAHELDSRIIDIIARQQPVASDLRALITALRMSADLERMGDMAHHVAKITRLRHPAAAIPSELLLTMEEMGKSVKIVADKCTEVIADRDLNKALEVEVDDDEVDRLHRKLFTSLLDESWPHGTETAIDITLIGRYYERFADHAVSIARRVYFLVTGTYSDKKD